MGRGERGGEAHGGGEGIKEKGAKGRSEGTVKGRASACTVSECGGDEVP